MSKLTVQKIKALEPAEKPYKVSDGMGLYLLVTPRGSKLWRMNYRYRGKQKTLSFGAYPIISLQEARNFCLEAKKLLAQGLDPSEHLKGKVYRDSSVLFKNIAEDFYSKYASSWDEEYASTVKLRLQKWIYPIIGDKPINEITIQDITKILDILIEHQKHGTAKKVKLIIGQIFRYAVLKGLTNFDPTQVLKGYIKHKEKHYPAATTPEAFKSILLAIWDYPHSITIKNALRTLIYTFQRPGEVVSMKWSQIDLKRKEWLFTLSKVQREHIVPLSRQMCKILEEQKKFTEYLESPFVFPSITSPKTRPIRVETLNAALKRIGINTKEEQTSHGFRAVARTLLHEVLGYEPDVIEHQLGHMVPDRLGKAYNRTRFIEKRREMMQKWADYVDSLIKNNS